jgi:hypothetical protein
MPKLKYFVAIYAQKFGIIFGFRRKSLRHIYIGELSFAKMPARAAALAAFLRPKIAGVNAALESRVLSFSVKKIF